MSSLHSKISLIGGFCVVHFFPRVIKLDNGNNTFPGNKINVPASLHRNHMFSFNWRVIFHQRT